MGRRKRRSFRCPVKKERKEEKKRKGEGSEGSTVALIPTPQNSFRGEKKGGKKRRGEEEKKERLGRTGDAAGSLSLKLEKKKKGEKKKGGRKGGGADME